MNIFSSLRKKVRGYYLRCLSFLHTKLGWHLYRIGRKYYSDLMTVKDCDLRSNRTKLIDEMGKDNKTKSTKPSSKLKPRSKLKPMNANEFENHFANQLGLKEHPKSRD